MARDEHCQEHENQRPSQVGQGHQPAPFEVVGERAGRQCQHEPGERVGCRDRRHRQGMGVHEQGEQGDCPVTEAVTEARYGEGAPEVGEPGSQRSGGPRRGRKLCSPLSPPWVKVTAASWLSFGPSVELTRQRGDSRCGGRVPEGLSLACPGTEVFSVRTRKTAGGARKR